MIRIAALTAALLLSGSMVAHAASLPSPVENISPGLTEQDIKTELEALGYSNVYDVRGAGRYYTAWANYQGVWYPLQIDIASGEVASLGNYDYEYIAIVSGGDIDHIAAELERLGYENVQKLEHIGGMYTFEVTQAGKEMRVHVDEESGEVHQLGQPDQN